jgi:hypothetical protein
MNLKRLVPISLIALSLSIVIPIANAEQLKRYKILYPNGSFIMNAGSSNPIVIEGYPSVYSTLIFYHDPRGIDNSVCAAGCRPVLDSYQNNVDEGTPTPTPSATPTPTPIVEKAPTGFADLVENYRGIPSVVWNEAQKLTEIGTPKSSFTIEIGPNTKIQQGLDNPRVHLEQASRLWSKFNQAQSTRIFIFNFQDLAWAQQKNLALGGSWFKPEDLGSNCSSPSSCGAFGGSYRGVGQIFLGVPIRDYFPFNLGFVRGTYVHEFSHVVQYSQFASQPSLNGYATLPCWFAEGQPQVPGHALGFANLPDYKKSRESWLSQPAGALGDYSPDSILKFYSQAGVSGAGLCSPSVRQRIYDLGYMTVEALASVKGIESTMQVVVGVSQGLTFNQSFEKVYGISWNEAAPILAKVVSRIYLER